MVGHSYVITLTKNFENKRWISKTLAWLKHMTEQIFWLQNFFGSGHFLIIYITIAGVCLYVRSLQILTLFPLTDFKSKPNFGILSPSWW